MKIEQLTREDILNDFYNAHLRNLVSAEINMFIYKEIIKHKGEKEIIGEKSVIAGYGQDGSPIKGVIKTKVIDALLTENSIYENQKNIVEAIKEIIKNG